MKKENNKIKFDFDNKESQKLFEEFTFLIADITKYVESQDEQIVLIGKELNQVQSNYDKTKEELNQVQSNYDKTKEELNQVQSNYDKTKEELSELQNKEKELLSKLELTNSGKYMVKAVVKKSVYRVNNSLGDIPRKVINKLKNVFK